MSGHMAIGKKPTKVGPPTKKAKRRREERAEKQARIEGRRNEN